MPCCIKVCIQIVVPMFLLDQGTFVLAYHFMVRFSKLLDVAGSLFCTSNKFLNLHDAGINWLAASELDIRQPPHGPRLNQQPARLVRLSEGEATG